MMARCSHKAVFPVDHRCPGPRRRERKVVKLILCVAALDMDAALRKVLVFLQSKGSHMLDVDRPLVGHDHGDRRRCIAIVNRHLEVAKGLPDWLDNNPEITIEGEMQYADGFIVRRQY